MAASTTHWPGLPVRAPAAGRSGWVAARLKSGLRCRAGTRSRGPVTSRLSPRFNLKSPTLVR